MRRRRSLRTRLVVAFVALAAGVLAVAGVTTYVLARTTAKQDALDDLQQKSDAVVANTRSTLRLLGGAVSDQTGRDTGPARELVQGFAVVLRLADARVVFLSDGGELLDGREVAPGLFGGPLVAGTTDAFSAPDVLAGRDDALHADRLVAGETVRGSVGSTVYVARPIELRARRIERATQPVLVLTKHVDTNVVGRGAPYFLIAAGVAFVVAILVAYWLARRMTRPARDMEVAARRLAAGDLSARVQVPEHTDDEFASLATTLNRMAGELETARGSERAFLLSISHDLRTPLTSIRGYAEALADGTLDGGDPEARARAASVITGEARRLERLVRDLLDLSRLDSRQFSLHPRPCDASTVVADAAEAFAPAAQEMGIALAVARNGTIPADLDPERLAQVVANLVENALKYATARVDVAVRDDEGAVEVTVVDDGPGVADAELAQVFERLYTGRSESGGRPVGTGLGLAIVRELAHAMGGTAYATRATDGGAKFVVRVPAGAQPAVWS